jgi:diguanylate cyclase (GGDEF)-like protein/PAS domain S-box-containing protein
VNLAGIRAANRHLLKTERRYRALFDRLPLLVGILDVGGTVLQANGQWSAYSGAPVAGTRLFSGRFVHADDAAAATDLLAAIDATNDVGGELRLRRADGVYRRHAARIVPLDDGDEDQRHWLCTLTDIETQRDRERLIARSNLALRTARVGIWDWDITTDTIIWDSVMFALYGFEGCPFSPTLERWISALHADDRSRVESEIVQAASTGARLDTEFRIVWPNGEVHKIRAKASVVCDESSSNGRMIGTSWDVTEIRSLTERLRHERELLLAEHAASIDAAARLRQSAERDRATTARLEEKNRLMAMAEQLAHVGHWRLDAKSKQFTWSEEIYRTFDLPTTFAPTLRNTLPFYHPDEREGVLGAVERALTTGKPFTCESRLRFADGTIRYLLSSGQAEYTFDGTISALFGVLQDVTETKDAERARERDMVRVSVATQAARVGVWECDLVADTLLWDPVMHTLYGFRSSAFMPTYDRWAKSLHDDDRARVLRQLELAASGGAPFDTEFRIVWPNGQVHNIRAMATLILDPDGSPERMIGTNWDITEVRSLAEQLRREKDAATFAAAHDGLTGLLNRRGLEAWVESQPGIGGTLLYLDLDRFKTVNDRGGHAAGDETLRRVARIVKDCIREQDVCARIGGDEFVVVLPDGTNEAIASLCERITAAIGSLRPLGADDPTRIGVSIGIGHLRGAASFDDASREADHDLFQCKSKHEKLSRPK